MDHQGELEVLQECRRPGRPRKLDSVGESILIATACSASSDPRTSWTLQLLADRLVQLEVIEAVSPNTNGRTLKKRLEWYRRRPSLLEEMGIEIESDE